MKLRLNVKEFYSEHKGILASATFTSDIEILDELGLVLGKGQLHLQGKIGYPGHSSDYPLEVEIKPQAQVPNQGNVGAFH